jgi:predicted RNase H-like HicB family nuclease
MEHSKNSLKAYFVEDPVCKGYTGFFAEFPQAVAEGKTQEEVEENLFKALFFMLKFNREDMQLEMVQYHEKKNVTEKVYNLQLG